jgi:hypothetical protein
MKIPVAMAMLTSLMMIITRISGNIEDHAQLFEATTSGL